MIEKDFGKFLTYLNEYYELLLKNKALDIRLFLLLKNIIQLNTSIFTLIIYKQKESTEILKRSLGEAVILIIVLIRLNKKFQQIYLNIYELHGIYEMMEILDISFTNSKSMSNKIQLRFDKLKQTIITEYKFENNISDKKLKKFIDFKLSVEIYSHAEVILKNIIKDKRIENIILPLLKSNSIYKAESNFVHSRYYSVVVSNFLNKKESNDYKNKIIKDTVDRTFTAILMIHIRDNLENKIEGEFDLMSKLKKYSLKIHQQKY